MSHPHALDLLTEAVRLAGNPEITRAARLLGADVDTSDDGTSFLGADPAPGVHMIQVLDREGDGRVHDIVLRMSDPVGLSELIARLGGYEIPTGSGHRQVHDVWFKTDDAVVTARCDRRPGPHASVLEVFIRPSR